VEDEIVDKYPKI